MNQGNLNSSFFFFFPFGGSNLGLGNFIFHLPYFSSVGEMNEDEMREEMGDINDFLYPSFDANSSFTICISLH